MHGVSNLDFLGGIAVDAGNVPKGSILPPLSAFKTPPSRRTKTLILPFNFDSEFQDNLGRTRPISGDEIGERTGVTVQIRGIQEPSGLIFAHPNQADLAESTGRKLRHPVMAHPCVIADWLEARGIDVQVYPDDDVWNRTRKVCRLQMVAHFAVADVAFLAGTGEFAETIRQLFTRKKLRQTRRLMALASGHKDARCGVAGLQPWLIAFEGVPYRLALEIVDSAALHGIAGYKALAANVGFPLDAKDRISRTGPNADISRMDEIYWEKPSDYDPYALGDLHVSDILELNEQLSRHIWETLGIERFFKGARLTIGSSVAEIVKARIAHLLGVNDPNDETLQTVTTGTHNAGYLSRLAKQKSPVALLSKVDGGRCRNANPLMSSTSGALCDIDISGAYASAMTAVPLIFGKARTKGFGNGKDARADLTECPTVAEMIRRIGHGQIPRTWFWRVSTREPYSFETDLIPSWIDWRVTLAERKTDSEIQGLDVLQDADSGEMRYFSREVWSGTLTSDLLDVARVTMSPGQFKEWSQKTVVRAALYVDRKDFLPLEDFRNGMKAETLPEFAWTSVTLGELVSDSARANRMQHEKKSPLNELFKLLSNTTYGVSVSRHFESSSTISGSNVTGCVRAFMFLCEKGLNLAGSITDGQLFDLNRVLHRKRAGQKVGDQAIGTRAYRMSGKDLNQRGEARFAPLAGVHVTIRWNGERAELTIHHQDGKTETLAGKDAEHRINAAAFEHLRSLWPGCPMLSEETRVVNGLNPDGTVKYETQKGLFRFEMKTFVPRAGFHGSANYRHDSLQPGKPPAIKMRSFESKREHVAYTLADDGLKETNEYDGHPPASLLMEAIISNPRAVPFLPPFAKTRILLPGVFQAQRKYKGSAVQVSPGDSIFVLGRPRLVSLTAFTFQTRRQYEGWKKAHTRLVNRYGVSFEMWFTNPDGTSVDYTRMMKAIDDAICEGVEHPIGHFDSIGKRVVSPTVETFHQAKKAMKSHLDSRVLVVTDEDLPIVYDERQEGFSGQEWRE